MWWKALNRSQRRPFTLYQAPSKLFYLTLTTKAGSHFTDEERGPRSAISGDILPWRNSGGLCPPRPGSSPCSARLLCTWTEGAGARGGCRVTLCHLRELGPTRSPGRGLAGRRAHTKSGREGTSSAHAQILGTPTHTRTWHSSPLHPNPRGDSLHTSPRHQTAKTQRAFRMRRNNVRLITIETYFALSMPTVKRAVISLRASLTQKYTTRGKREESAFSPAVFQDGRGLAWASAPPGSRPPCSLSDPTILPLTSLSQRALPHPHSPSSGPRSQSTGSPLPPALHLGRGGKGCRLTHLLPPLRQNSAQHGEGTS